jgi:AbrB family looped-hinge helix DNA binding protein
MMRVGATSRLANVRQKVGHRFKGTTHRERATINYRGNILIMSIARSRLTSQGQVSVPAEVRRRLGIAPGSLLEWDEDGGQIVVRRVGRYTSEDIHRSLFPEGSPKTRTVEELKDGIRKYIRKRHARR